jgi:hypothetical protein
VERVQFGSVLRQRFQFPTKLWLALSLGIFLFLFLGVKTGFKDEYLTTFRWLVSGDFGAMIFWGVTWGVIELVVSVCVAAYLAALFAVFKALFQKSGKK